MEKALQIIDWFIPQPLLLSNSEKSIARNFVFTHLSGPLMSQTITIFLHRTDPDGGWRVWTITICVWLFMAMPFLLRATGNLKLCAFLTVQLLSFVALFGAFHYGGATSPFLPWLIVSLLLAFFYLSRYAAIVIAMFAMNFAVFSAAYLLWGFTERVSRESLEMVGWFSILSAVIYVGWMAIYYTSMLTMRNELLRANEELAATTKHLRAAKQYAEQANAQRSIFLAKMSHELRTPLNAVIGYSEMILEAAQGDDRKVKDLNRINTSGKHLLALVTEVLDIGSIERNEIAVDATTFDVATFASELVTTTENLVKTNHNQFDVQIAPNLASVHTDQTKLRQVCLNLLSNAAKFTKHGVISLVVRRDRTLSGDWLEVQVRDTGIGIAPEELSRLFTHFGQASASTSSKFGGTGIGLAHSQRLCGLLGGRITIQSEVGKGSTLVVRIPANLTLVSHRRELAEGPLVAQTA